MALPTNVLKVRSNAPVKMLGRDRVLELKPRPNAKTSTGVIDHRVFSGENRLHAIYNEQTQLWFLKYDKGAVPPALQQSFTSFTMLMKFCVPYFDKRNVDIIEIDNAEPASSLSTE